MVDIVRCQGGCAFSPELQGSTTGQTPFFKVSDMNLRDNQWVMRSANNYVNDGDRKHINGAEKPAGSVIFPKVGATIFTNKKRLLIQPAFVDNNVMAVWSTDVKRCIPAFLYLHFLTVSLSELSNPGPLPSINNSKIYEQSINLPPVSEQKKMAAVIWHAQRAIEVEDKLIARSRELKQSAMHQLFTRGLRGEPQKETEFGPIPASWQPAMLVELFAIKHGYAFDGQFFADTGEYVLLTPGHFYEHGGFRDRKEKTKYYTSRFPEDLLLKRDDLLVAMTEQKGGLLGSSALIPESDKYLHNQRLGLIVDLDTSRLDKRFLYHFFNTEPVRGEIARTASGSKVRHTSPSRILDLRISLPTLEEQRDCAVILDAIDRKIAVHERKRATLQELFKTLLHQLMTGQIRVDSLDIDVSEVEVIS